MFPILVYICIKDKSDGSVIEAEQNEQFTPSIKKAGKFLIHGGVLLISISATFAASSLGFFAVSFSPHLQKVYDINSEEAGKFYLPFTISG